MPIPRGKSVLTHCFVDAKHAGEKTTRRSMTGILIFCNIAPIIWHSKRKIVYRCWRLGHSSMIWRTLLSWYRRYDTNWVCLGSPLTDLLTFSVTMSQYIRMHPRPNISSGRNTKVYCITWAGRRCPVVHAVWQSKILRLTSQISPPRCYHDQGGNYWWTVSLIE